MSDDETKLNEKERTWEGCYGSHVSYADVGIFLQANFSLNEAAEKRGTERFATCIWGHSGVGKTALVKQHCRKPVTWNGEKWKGYTIYDVPIAMFEEMGDLHGLPERHVRATKENSHGDFEMWVPEVLAEAYKKDGWQIDHRAGTRTLYAKPDWAPSEEGPSILLLDDWNRSSVRIIKGIMQLLQNYRMVSWGLPAGCNIVLTSNPDDQDYLVTTLDQAILSRIRHVTLIEDAKEWSVWAAAEDLDPRGINFVLAYPEMMIGRERTNPRSLSEFFRFLKTVPDLSDIKSQNFRIARIMAESLLDEETVTSMMVFMTRDVEMIVEPEDILSGDLEVLEHLKDLMTRQEKRIDVLGVVCDRLFAHMMRPQTEINEETIKSFQKFITMDELEEDMRHNMCFRIAQVRDDGRMREWILRNNKLKHLIMEVVT